MSMESSRRQACTRTRPKRVGNLKAKIKEGSETKHWTSLMTHGLTSFAPTAQALQVATKTFVKSKEHGLCQADSHGKGKDAAQDDEPIVPTPAYKNMQSIWAARFRKLSAAHGTATRKVVQDAPNNANSSCHLPIWPIVIGSCG
jgi:hypothetical protein